MWVHSLRVEPDRCSSPLAAWTTQCESCPLTHPTCWLNWCVLVVPAPPSLIPLAPQGSLQAPDRPESLAFVEMAADATAAGGSATRSTGGLGSLGLYLNVGLVNGVLQRVAVDGTSGALSDTRARFLGNRPVKLFRVKVHVSWDCETQCLT